MAENVNPERAVHASLSAAIHDAQTLLAFASQSGAGVGDEVVKTVVETASLAAGGHVTEESETAFWKALNMLAKAVAPVSVSSLRATLDPDAGGTTTVFGVAVSRGSLARRAVRWYTGIAILTLLLLLVLQIYWLFGTSLTSDIQKFERDIADADAKLWALQKVASAPQGVPRGASAGKSVDTREHQEIQVLKPRIEDLELRKASAYRLLGIWSGPWESVAGIRSPEVEGEDPAKEKARGRIALHHSSLFVLLEVLQRYFLPLLYGLLGTCVYVLRTLASEIKARTYSEASNIGFRIRLYLGTLGGMVIAWFVSPESSDGLLRSLSPFALAFLSGYSVELLFAAMDRFLSAFTSR